MPYKSKAQEAYMHIHHPEIAKRWDKEHNTPHDLPQHVNKREHSESQMMKAFNQMFENNKDAFKFK